MRRSILATALLVGCLVPAAAPPAGATFDGDNGRIAFRRFLNDAKTWGAVFTIRPDGKGERQITHPPRGYVDRNPDVSPDGRRIAFEREGVDCEPGCRDEIWVVDADGSDPTRLTRQQEPGATCETGGYCDATPGWSPDGKHIVFSRATGPFDEATGLIERVALYVMRDDGTHVKRLTQKSLPADGEDAQPQWSPNGNKILFERWNVRKAKPADAVALWVLDLRTGEERRITPYSLMAGDTPDWSPNGRLILFHDHIDAPPNVSANLWTVRPDGSGLTQLTFVDDGVTNYLGSSFSPDGTMIVFGRRPATGGPDANAADVFVMRLDGTGEQAVTSTLAYDSYPDWGPRPH
jgi:TolB protein